VDSVSPSVSQACKDMRRLISPCAKGISGPEKFGRHPKKTFATLSPQKRTEVGHRAMSVSCHERKRPSPHSITSSASDIRLSEILTPSALAVFKLMTSSNFVGCKTGRSAGCAPLTMRAVRHETQILRALGAPGVSDLILEYS
jgi:hypothetical protein